MTANQNFEPAAISALRFARSRIVVVLAISAVLLIPSFWHRHLEAGDLASHTYNAWLAQLITRGQAPGLAIAPQRTNILADIVLQRLGGAIGFEVAEKIVAAVAVLIFFWGAFALIHASSQNPPWTLIPAIAVVTYGWTFQMGFLNYYLALGCAFFSLALFWRGSRIDWVVGILFAALVLAAHPMGFVSLVALAAYIKLAERTRGIVRSVVFALALLALVAIHFYVVGHWRTQYWDTRFFYVMSGADQLVLFGSRYAQLAAAAVFFGSGCFLCDFYQRKGTAEQWNCRTALELWALLIVAAAMLPELLQLSLYARPVGFLISRLTSITAVMGLCVLANTKTQRWHGVGFSVIAVIFFALLFIDTGTLNTMENQAEGLVSGLSFGRRVITRIEAPKDWRVRFIDHLVDGACIGRCFVYANYEASSAQFRIRANAENGIVSNSADDVDAIAAGTYVVRRQVLPMTLIYQCDVKDWTHLCRKDLAAGETVGAAGSR